VRDRIAILAALKDTWIEWALYAACWLRKLGHASTILYSRRDVSPIVGDPSGRRSFRQRFFYGDFWEATARIPDVALVDLDREPEPVEAVMACYGDFAADYAHTLAAYEMRVEEHEEGALRERYLRQVEQEEKKLLRRAAAAEGVFRRLEREQGVRRFITFNGLIGITAAMREAARRLGWDAVFVEAYGLKPGMLLYNVNAPALDYAVKDWIGSIDDWDERRLREMQRFLDYQDAGGKAGAEMDLADSQWLEGLRNYQPTSSREKLPECIERFLADGHPPLLLAPNVVGDSATLRRQTIFRSQREWIREVCAFFRENPHRKLIVRTHPGEVLMGSRLALGMADLAMDAAMGAPNILVVRGDESVSTYAIVPHVRGGLTWVSNVGVDMVARNCPVLSAARPQYGGIGITCEPQSREEYFSVVPTLAEGGLRVTAEQRELAVKCLAVVWRYLGYTAFGPGFRGQDLRLAGHPQGGECETFYRILAGDLPPGTRPTA
jgi:hypothetical protein